MKKSLKVLLMLVVLAFSTFSAVLATKVLSEERITTEEGDQYDPAIYGDIVVWYDYRNGNNDIYGRNIRTMAEEFPICTDDGDQYDPAIYGDIVVWQDDRNGNINPDIWGYNLKTKEEFPICTDGKRQFYPAIYGDIVVWQDERNWDGGNYDIYGRNIRTMAEEFQITTNTESQMKPAIYGDIVVWYDDRNNSWDIYGRNIRTMAEDFPICTFIDSTQSMQAIYGDIVVWQDARNHATTGVDIYGYNLKTKQEFPICTEEGDQEYSAIYCDRVVWEDDRNGIQDIYLAYIDVVCETAKKSLPMEGILKILGLWPKE